MELIEFRRCCAPSNQLDSNETYTCRSHTHAEALKEAFNVKELWDGYGVISNVIVCELNYSVVPSEMKYSPSRHTSLELISMSSCHRTYSIKS